MNALPAQMRDRWQDRVDQAPGEGVVYWHMPMHDYPEVVDLARDARRRLAPFSGLHMTPLERLHMTTMIAGPATGFSRDQLARMAATATNLLAAMPLVTVTVGRILYHPEAIMLGVSPARALAPVREAALKATRLVTGRDISAGDAESWIPHITVCYSTAHQPAAPLIEALGESLPGRDIQIRALSLIIQQGPERRWDWNTVATIPLAA